MSNQTIASGYSANLTFNTFTRAGYAFVGWATTPSGDVAYVDGASYTMGAINVTLYAKWVVSYTITFDKNDSNASGSMSNQTIGSGYSANLTLNTFTRADYVFVGWTTTPSGDVVYADGASYTMGSGNVILYARWLHSTLVSVTKREIILISGGAYNQTDGTDSFNHTISSFSIAKYEVTYELWWTVRQWAITNGYTFANNGYEGSSMISGSPTARKLEPVTTINWCDAIVWCNAYSEMSGFTPCYTYSGSTIKDSRDTNATACNSAVCNWSASGYRLPSEGEWQYVASNKGATPYDYASGATASYSNSTETGRVAWYYTNSGGSTKNVETKAANALGLYDMSGNVSEWCWDWYGTNYPTSPQTNYRGFASGSYRTIRGGGWDTTSERLRLGVRNYCDPKLSRASVYANNEFGFRVARSTP